MSELSSAVAAASSDDAAESKLARASKLEVELWAYVKAAMLATRGAE